jgi:hypothetical protein
MNMEESVTITSSPRGTNPVESWVEEAARTHLDKHQIDELKWLVSHPAAPESLLIALCDRGLFLVELAHRSGPRTVLEKLAEEHRVPEAILSIGKKLYTDPSESTRAFTDFLERHKDSIWLLKSLAFEDATPLQKEAAYVEQLRSSPALFDEFFEIRKTRQRQEEARKASDPEAIAKLYASGDPTVLRALAGNRHTSDDILSALANLGNVKHAATIRNLARNTLKSKALI